MRQRSRPWSTLVLVPALVLPAATAHAGDVTFSDVAADVGVTFRRTPSVENAWRELDYARGIVTIADLTLEPLKWGGAPGVVLFDHDDDGDVDIFATNGPLASNALYSNQLAETGVLGFIDVAEVAGVGLPLMDGNGACAGDIDNDGDQDLYVLGRDQPNHLLENQGGTFVDITLDSGTDAGTSSHISCTMGDVNGDGLLDIFVANTFDMTTSLAIFVEPYLFNQPNHLLINVGSNLFIDDSERSGIRNVEEITWGAAMVDYDLDGDVDIVTASDNGAIPAARYGGVDRGFLRIYDNDGAGNFADVTSEANLWRSGDWMGVAFGDLNCDGYLDMFGTNLGDYILLVIPPFPYSIGDYSSRWFLGGPNKVFSDPGVGSLIATPFAWGTSIFDFDNDADQDIAFYGALHHGLFHSADNRGALLENQGCDAQFTNNTTAIETDHSLRNVNGMATADLDRNGFVDIVAISGEDKEPDTVYSTYPATGGAFDAGARWVEVWHCDGFFPACFFYFTDNYTVPGRVTVELNSGGNGNRAVDITAMGSIDLTTRGVVNRDGVGAMMTFRPKQGKATMLPVLAGSSHASQHERALHFGLGTAAKGTLDVLWPGGVVNRLYDVLPGERLRFPEIPCSFREPWSSKSAYLACVDQALDELVDADAITLTERTRFRASASTAYDNP